MSVIGDVREQAQMDRELKGADVVVLLAAQHRDDVSPVSLYYDTNVGGMEVTLKAMEKNGCKRIIFFSSVAVYGLNKKNPNESHPADPFNHYGKSKWQAEEVLQKWYESHPDWNINIIRPTVVFGERNRGNVYNLLKQISSGRFLMVGKGENKKSMAYVGNIVSFVKFLIDNKTDRLQCLQLHRQARQQYEPARIARQQGTQQAHPGYALSLLARHARRLRLRPAGEDNRQEAHNFICAREEVLRHYGI